MGNSPLISVIITCYNHSEYISKAIDSVKEQSFPNIELIVVDDGSDVATKRILNDLKDKIDTLLTQENQGVCTARNKGIQRARGEFIFILDGDDYIETTLIEKAMDIMIQKHEVKIVSSWARRIKDEKLISILKTKGGNYLNFLFNNAALGTSLYRTKDLMEVGSYDIVFNEGFEDWELNLRLLGTQGLAYVIPEPLYNYRILKGSRNENAVKLKSTILKKIITKNLWLYQQDEAIFKFWDYLEQKNTKISNIEKSIPNRITRMILKPWTLIRKM